MNRACMQFAYDNITEDEIRGKTILEVGSYNVNGSYRPHLLKFQPASYIGTDMRPGPMVDRVCSVDLLTTTFGEEAFDVVICTEMLEHAHDWRLAIWNIKTVLKAGGLLVLTTRSLGFPKHDYPGDYWRFEVEDMRAIFADCEILALDTDKSEPGVFIRARRGPSIQTQLTQIHVYSMITGGRGID